MNPVQHKSPPLPRPKIPPAPELTSKGLCSDCQVPAIVAGENNLKVCPRCYALLWRASSAASDHAMRAAATAKAVAAARKAAIARITAEAAQEKDQQAPPVDNEDNKPDHEG